MDLKIDVSDQDLMAIANGDREVWEPGKPFWVPSCSNSTFSNYWQYMNHYQTTHRESRQLFSCTAPRCHATFSAQAMCRRHNRRDHLGQYPIKLTKIQNENYIDPAGYPPFRGGAKNERVAVKEQMKLQEQSRRRALVEQTPKQVPYLEVINREECVTFKDGKCYKCTKGLNGRKCFTEPYERKSWFKQLTEYYSA